MEKFQSLLRELFQFDCADLDFGIYRIMNHKREAIEHFIAVALPQAIAEDLTHGALAEQSQAAQELDVAKKGVLDALGDDALDAAGVLAEAYRNTKAGQRYLAAFEKAQTSKSHDALEAAIYNHLYAFFSRYWQDGDFISKRRYSKRERYAIPYNGEEVMLYWANHDQYYVKTGEYFTDYTWRATTGVTVQFKLKAADVEQNNVKGEKRFFLPQLGEMVWDDPSQRLTIPFEFRPLTAQEAIAYGKRNQQEAINTEAVEKLTQRHKGTKEEREILAASCLGVRTQTAEGKPVSYLEHHLRQYTRRNTSDFFIHKDLQGFLSRELDFYLKNEVLNLDELEAAGEGLGAGWFQLMRLIKQVGNRIIEFLAGIEAFQKMLWEKRKFVVETFYCIAVGAIDAAFYPEIAACEAQWEEWEALFHIAHEDTKAQSNLGVSVSLCEKRVACLKAHPTLVLDTRRFDGDFADRLLASFADLDEMTDGVLVNSENWQALNFLLNGYRGRVGSIYIDPPYNTDASPILYKNGYKSSTWSSLMENRLRATRALLKGDGVLVAAIDDEQHRELSFLLSSIYDGRLLGTFSVRANPSGRPTKTGYSVAHEYLLYVGAGLGSAIGRMPPTEKQMARFSQHDDTGLFEWRNLRREGSNSDRAARRALYYPIYLKGESLRIPKMNWDETDESWIVEEQPLAGEQVVLPDNEDGVQKTWRWEWKTVLDSMEDLAVRKDRSGKDYVYYKRRPHEEGVVSMSCWFNAKYSAIEHGTTLLMDMFGEKVFSYPKSIYAVLDSLYIAGARRPETCILDFFAGSGTTAHAVINLNRQYGGSRRFILVEVEKYFDTVLLPRIKKVTFTPEWKDGKPKRMATAEEAERGPRLVKVIRLESYEDALDNIAFDETSGQQALPLEDDMLQYMLAWETRHSETLLNVEKLDRPFAYALRLHRDGETRVQPVDLPETFNYLIGLNVQTRKVCDDNGRRYLIYRGLTREGRKVTVLWRETDGWTQADYLRDRDFVAAHKLAEGVDEVYVNGDSFIPGARALDGLFKERLFAPVEA